MDKKKEDSRKIVHKNLLKDVGTFHIDSYGGGHIFIPKRIVEKSDLENKDKLLVFLEEDKIILKPLKGLVI